MPHIGYYGCGTEGNVAAKVISDATGYVLSTGGSIKVKMTNANTADNATLNINSTGAKALYYAGERASANNSWEAGETVEVYYDGTNFYANSVAGGSGSGNGAFDISAKTGNHRPEFERLKDNIKAKKINTIVALKLDRITRSIYDWENLMTFLDENDAYLDCVNDEINTTSANGKMISRLLMSVRNLSLKLTITFLSPPLPGALISFLPLLPLKKRNILPQISSFLLTMLFLPTTNLSRGSPACLVPDIIQVVSATFLRERTISQFLLRVVLVPPGPLTKYINR